MNRKPIIIAAVLLLAASPAILVSCEAENEPKKLSIVDEIVDSLSAALATVAQPDEVIERVVPFGDTGNEEALEQINEVADIVVLGSKMYGASDGGLIVYDFVDKTHFVAAVDDRLEAVVVHNGTVYVGGVYLYTLDDSSLTRHVDEFTGAITRLYSYDNRLIVGTSCGLFSKSVLGHELLMDDITVSAIAADNDGLWVGSSGQGLYRWDGERFQKRYLIRDPALFDNINALDFKHDHLYVGSDNGLHIHDGGRWETMTTLEGLPSNNVTAVDASAWVVYVGTDEGLVSFFNDEIAPVGKLENQSVNCLKLRQRDIIVGTRFDGILMQSGRTLKTLVEPTQGIDVTILSVDW